MSHHTYIKGIGTDIVEISRIESNLQKFGDNFLHKILTEKEVAYCKTYKESAPIVAGRFAAKEAIVKALGVGFGDVLQFHDIEIVNDVLGKPNVFLSPSAKQRFLDQEIELSISHCKSHAVAFAISIMKTGTQC